VKQHYASLNLPEWLNGRARELWKPLLAVAALADSDPDGLSITTDLYKIARDHVTQRPGLSAEAEALLGVLVQRLRSDARPGDAAITVRPGDLREPLRVQLGWPNAPNAEVVGSLLRRLGFERLLKDRDGARYKVTVERLGHLDALRNG